MKKRSRVAAKHGSVRIHSIRGGDGTTPRPSGRPRMIAFFCATVLAVGILLPLGFPEPARADAPLHEVTWAHGSSSQVRRFVVYVSEVDGDIDIARQIDVGKPFGRVSGTIQFFSAIIPAGFDEFVAVAAVAADGTLSPPSAWSGLPPSRPGQPVVVP